MPKKLRKPEVTPSLVQERLVIWGRAIRAQRVAQKILATDLCTRVGISDATLRRLERGDPGASAAAYLSALMTVGLLDFAVPTLDSQLWSANPQARARTVLSDVGDDNF